MLLRAKCECWTCWARGLLWTGFPGRTGLHATALRAVNEQGLLGVGPKGWAPLRDRAKALALTSWLLRRQGEQLVRCGQFDGLVELATICALCNDSALDYNEVAPSPLHDLPRIQAARTDPCPRVPALSGLVGPAPLECHTAGALPPLYTLR